MIVPLFLARRLAGGPVFGMIINEGVLLEFGSAPLLYIIKNAGEKSLAKLEIFIDIESQL